MATESKKGESQGDFLAGLITSGQLGQQTLNEESIRRAFAAALGVDPTIGTSQSSCHFVKALMDAGVLVLNK